MYAKNYKVLIKINKGNLNKCPRFNDSLNSPKLILSFNAIVIKIPASNFAEISS